VGEGLAGQGAGEAGLGPEGFEGAGKGERGSGVEIEGSIAADFAEGRAIRAEDGAPTVHRLHDGHAEALIERRKNEGEAGIEQGGEIFIGKETGEQDGPMESESLDKRAEDPIAIAGGSGKDEESGDGGIAPAEEGEGGEEEFVVLVEPEIGRVKEKGCGLEAESMEEGKPGGGGDDRQALVGGVADDEGFRRRGTGGGLDAGSDIVAGADEEAGDGAGLPEVAMADEAVVFGEELGVGEELEVVDEADGWDGGVMVGGGSKRTEEEIGAEGAEEALAIQGEESGLVGEAETPAEIRGDPGGEAGFPAMASGNEASREGGGRGVAAASDTEAVDVGGFQGSEFVMARGAREEDELGLGEEGGQSAEEFESEGFGSAVFAAGAEWGQVDNDAGEWRGGRDGRCRSQLAYLGEC